MKRYLFFVFFIVIGSFLFGGMVLAGVGLTPTIFPSKAICPGCSFEKVFIVSDSSPQPDQIVSIFIKDDFLKNIIEVEDYYEWEEGSKTVNVPIKFNVPMDVDLGEVSGSIDFIIENNSSDGSGGSGLAVSSGVTLRFDWLITNEEVIDYTVNNLDFSSYKITHSGEELHNINLVASITNDGNVPLVPDRVEVEFFNKYTKESLEKHILTDWQDEVPIFSTKKLFYEFSTSLVPGSYPVLLTYYDGDEKKFEMNKMLFINVDGSIKTGTLEEFNLNKDIVSERDTVKMLAKYKNTFKDTVVSKLKVKILDQNNKEVDFLVSDLKDVPGYGRADFIINYTPKKEGLYTLEAYVDMEGTMSNKITKVLEVKHKPLTPEERMMRMIKILFVALISLVALIIFGVIFVIFFIKKKKKKKKKKGRKPTKKKTTTTRKRGRPKTATRKRGRPKKKKEIDLDDFE